MKNKAFLIFTGIVLILTFGCKDKKESKQRNQAVFDAYKNEVQTFILTDKTETFIGKKGTKITIDPKSLNIDGGNEISGKIEIQLTEYYELEDIILANLSTSSNGNLIETAGMIKLTASFNGKEVVVKNGEEFKIEFATSEKKGMEIFYGEFDEGKINWVPNAKSTHVNKGGFFSQAMAQNDESLDTATGMADSIARNNILKSSKFGWINCDRFLGLNNLTTLKLSYDTVYKPSAYLVFKEMNSIMPCFYEKKYGKFINLPIGHNVTLIAFSWDGERLFFSTKEILIDEEVELNIDFVEIPLDGIKEKIIKTIE